MLLLPDLLSLNLSSYRLYVPLDELHRFDISEEEASSLSLLFQLNPA